LDDDPNEEKNPGHQIDHDWMRDDDPNDEKRPGHQMWLDELDSMPLNADSPSQAQ